MIEFNYLNELKKNKEVYWHWLLSESWMGKKPICLLFEKCETIQFVDKMTNFSRFTRT